MPRGRPKKTTDDMLLKSAELLGWALGGLEREIDQTRQRLASLTAQAGTLRARLGPRAASLRAAVAAAAADGEASVAGVVKRRRKMSAEARKRISEMMKKKWAERKKAAK